MTAACASSLTYAGKDFGRGLFPGERLDTAPDCSEDRFTHISCELGIEPLYEFTEPEEVGVIEHLVLFGFAFELEPPHQ